MDNKSFFNRNKFTIILISIMVIITLIVFFIGQTPKEKTPSVGILMMFILLIVGFAAGLLGGWIGTGGCSVMLPILHFWLGYPASIAVGTTLVAVIFTSISGGYGHFIRKNLDKRVTLWLGGFGVLGVILGSWLFTFLSGKSALLGFIIGIVFLWPAIRMIWDGIIGYRKRKADAKSNMSTSTQLQSINGHPTKLSVFGFIVGVLTGIVGLGGGYALVPGLIYLFGAPVYITMGTSLAVMIPMAIVGGAIKLAQGYVFLLAALILGIGTIIGAQVGAATIKKFRPYTLKLIFGIYFLYVAIKFIGTFLGIRVW